MLYAVDRKRHQGEGGGAPRPARPQEHHDRSDESDRHGRLSRGTRDGERGERRRVVARGEPGDEAGEPEREHSIRDEPRREGVEPEQVRRGDEDEKGGEVRIQRRSRARGVDVEDGDDRGQREDRGDVVRRVKHRLVREDADEPVAREPLRVLLRKVVHRQLRRGARDLLVRADVRGEPLPHRRPIPTTAWWRGRARTRSPRTPTARRDCDRAAPARFIGSSR